MPDAPGALAESLRQPGGTVSNSFFQDGGPGTARAYSKLPLSFVPNVGRTDGRVRYYAQGAGFSFYFTDDRAVLALDKGGHGQALHLRFVGANPKAELVATDPASGRVNHLTGARRQTDLPTYNGLVYRDLWPGIDMAFRGAGGKLKYEFRVAAGANPGDIRLAYAGADDLSLGAGGALLIDTPRGPLRDARPQTYQRIDGRRVAVDSRYALAGSSAYGFAVQRYDRGRPLVIDPSLAYSAYLGGSGGERSRSIAVDSLGAAYVVGDTPSTNFPTTVGAFDTSISGRDVFVTKVNPAGSALVYSTFLGGSLAEEGWDIAVDSAGAAYVTGRTNSGANFPTTVGAFDTTFNGGGTSGTDAFVTKLNPTGSALDYSTYLGGGGASALEEGRSIAVDSLGAAYVTGITNSGNFPTTAGAFDTIANGGTDAFITKLNAAGSALDYSTFLGGSAGSAVGPIELGRGIAVDSLGAAYVSGITASTNFPTTAGAFNTSSNGGNDGFVTKLTPAGSSLDYSSYLGGSNNEGNFEVAVDSLGAAYVTGRTVSTDFPTTGGAFDTTYNGNSDVYVTKLNPAGSSLDYSTHLGGSAADGSVDGTQPLGIAVASGVAYISGGTQSSNFPTTADALDTTYNGDEDAFVTKLNAAGSALEFSTFMGGSGTDEGGGIAVDSVGDAYISGRTESTNFPTTTDGFDTTHNGNFDAFPAKIAFDQTADLAITKSDDPDPAFVGDTITYTLNVTNNGPSTATGVNVTDNLPAGTSYQSATASQGSCSEAAGTVSCSLGTLAANASATVDIDVTADSDGTLTDTATVDGDQADPDAANDSDTEETTVEAPATVKLTPLDAVNNVDTDHTVTATVKTASARPFPNATVRLSVQGSVTTTGSCSTNTLGQCTFTYNGPSLPGADLIDAFADTNGDGDRDAGEPEAVPVTKAWVAPATAPGHVTGGGQFLNPAGNDKIAFGFNAKSNDGTAQGECNVVDPSTETHVKCTDATSVLISGTHATIFGNAEVNDMPTTYRIDVDDLAEPGRNQDTFRIRTASGYDVGRVLTQGNIQIHNAP